MKTLDPVNVAFGQRLGRLRKRLGLSHEELARRLNVSRPRVYQLESGESSPLWTTVVKIASVLGVTPDQFLA